MAELIQVKIDGAEVTANTMDLLALARVEQTVGLPDEIELRFYDPNVALLADTKAKIGSTISVAFLDGTSFVTVGDGEVTAISIDQSIEAEKTLVITGMDKSHRLHRKVQSRTFLKKTDDAIAKEVGGIAGLSVSADATGVTHEWVLQQSKSDFDFLQERAQRYGMDVWVSGSTLNFKKRESATASGATLKWGEDLMNLQVRVSAVESTDEVKITGWDAKQKQAVSGTANSAASGVEPAINMISRLKSGRSSFGTRNRSAAHLPVDSADDAKKVAEGMLRRAQSAQVVLRAEAFGDPNLAVGKKISVEGVGDFSGTYTLTNVVHVYSPDVPYITRVSAGPVDGLGLPDLIGGLSAGQRQIASAAEGWRGVVPGVVTNVNDPENLGRVKVKIAILSDQHETDWCRVLSLGAGPDRGFTSIPEVQDEVLVAFELGDPTRPVVLGGLWNSKDKIPPSAIADGKVGKRLVVSRLGHKIEFDDAEKGKINISTKDGKSVVTVDADGGITIKTDKDITVDATGDLKLKAGKALSVEATQGLTLKGQSVEVNGSQEVKVSGGQIKLN